MKRYLIAAVIITVIFSVHAAAFTPMDQSGQWQKTLNGQWKFMLNCPDEKSFFKTDFDESNFKPIIVPGNWEVQGFEPLGAYRKPKSGSGYYRKSFKVPSGWEDRKIFIRLEGVLWGYDLWVNGKSIGSNESAFTRADYDITDAVNLRGENLVAVKVYKLRKDKGSRFDSHDSWALSGIQRDVIIYSVDKIYVNDLTIVTDLTEDLKTATVKVDYTIKKNSKANSGNIAINSELIGPAGTSAGKFSQQVKTKSNNAYQVNDEFKITDPLLWNAETPNLYELKVDLTCDCKSIHSFTRKVGIRKITIDGDVLKLNYRPIKIRGVNHHDIDPDSGRALRKEHYLRDIKLMKGANINAIRTSHYPSHPVMLDLCDEYGMYVIDEVPFGTNDDKDEKYLLARAEATVSRDKNHPCVIVWSVGNENSIEKVTHKVCDRVKDLDATRPKCLPGGGESGNYSVPLPESVELVTPHYPFAYNNIDNRWGLEAAANEPDLNRPVIATEMNHSLGTAFEGVKERWEVIEKYPQLAGGCIWHFMDQGLRRDIEGAEIITDLEELLFFEKSKKEKAICANTWIDEQTVLDSKGGSGFDGIVYADRFPQSDYYLVRKVFSNVVIPETTSIVKSGKQKVELTVLNRFDFTSMEEINGKWELVREGKTIQTGSLKLSAGPHKSEKIELEINLSKDIENTDHWINFQFFDSSKKSIYEKTVRLIPDDGMVNFAERLTDLKPMSIITKVNGSVATLSTNTLAMEIDKSNGSVCVKFKDSGEDILSSQMLRVGRQPAMAEYRQAKRDSKFFWRDRLLDKPRVHNCEITQGNGNATVLLKLEYFALEEKRRNQSVIANYKFTISEAGWIDVDYELSPKNAKGYFLELGTAFKMPPERNQLTWLGEGPYNSYPRQTEANEYGIYHIEPKPITDPESRYYKGNRANVNLAAVTDRNGQGAGFIFDGATISLVKHNGSMVFSHIARVAGKGNKPGGMITHVYIKADKVKSEKGSFRIVPLPKNNWPCLFKEVLQQTFEK